MTINGGEITLLERPKVYLLSKHFTQKIFVYKYKIASIGEGLEGVYAKNNRTNTEVKIMGCLSIRTREKDNNNFEKRKKSKKNLKCRPISCSQFSTEQYMFWMFSVFLFSVFLCLMVLQLSQMIDVY